MAITGLSGDGVYRKEKGRREVFPFGEQTNVFQAKFCIILQVATNEEVKIAIRRKFASSQECRDALEELARIK